MQFSNIWPVRKSAKRVFEDPVAFVSVQHFLSGKFIYMTKDVGIGFCECYATSGMSGRGRQ